jgi:uncharacterized protein
MGDLTLDFLQEVHMVSSGTTEIAIETRDCAPTDIPDLHAFLTASLPMSAHVAGVLEPMEGSAERIATCVHGSWINDELQAVILTGQVLRVVTSTPELIAVLVDRLRHHITDNTQAVMGSEAVVHALQRSLPGTSLRQFEVWEHGAGTTRAERVGPPTTAELPSFASASFQAFEEELGFAPADHPHVQAYLELWERARERGRILGAWDEKGRCIFRVEIRPALGLVAELRGLWLDPVLRGAGVARALLEETVGYVTTTIAPRVQVIAYRDNPAAGRLYRRVGFIPVGRLARLELPKVSG